jgi:hypothetical protein
MADNSAYLQLLRQRAARILKDSPGLESLPKATLEAAEMVADPAVRATGVTESAALEAIVRWYRPVLTVTDDRFVISTANPNGDPRFDDPNAAASKALMDTLEKKRAVLDPVIRSVGRIELVNNSRYPWVGTGWIVGSDLGSDIVVTNAHVGQEFGMRSGAGFVFRPGIPDKASRQSARIDFREEVGMASPREFPITDIIWISETPGLDVCLLRVARTAGSDRIDPPVKLLTSAITDDRMLAVIGFPGSSNGYDPAMFQKLFGSVTGNKRFSPGFHTGRHSDSVTYDCSTLPGSSGSVVVDVLTGRAVGLHYAGTAFDMNYAVPATDLARVIAKRPWQSGEASKPRPLLGDDAATPVAGDAPVSAVAMGGDIRVVVPLEITVRLGGASLMAGTSAAPAPVPSTAPSPSPSPLPAKTDAASAANAAEKVRTHLLGDKSVLSVKSDFLFRDGQITDDVGVIVGVAPGSSLDPASYGLSERIGGVAVSVETADPTTIAEQFAFKTEAFGGRKANYARDNRRKPFNLSPVTDEMSILLHVSPEAGWPVLKEFLGEKDSQQLTIGMYHMTAPHVVKAITAIAKRPTARITLTLDRQRGDADEPDDISGPTKENDIPEQQTLDNLAKVAKSRFKWAPASLGGSGLFASAYHIKVAVWSKRGTGAKLDDRSFWLSSGNWQSSNQAPLNHGIEDIDKVTQEEVSAYNREWHALVKHAGLASTFRSHLEQDFEDNAKAAEQEAPLPAMFDVMVPLEMAQEAVHAKDFQAFEPELLDGRIKVQPLLTPDNYPDVVKGLIAKAESRVLIENQSFNFWKDIGKTPEHFLNILECVRDRQKQGLDVRVIFRSGFGKERETLRQMKKFGLKADEEHVRYFDKCHTKGLVIDDEVAVLGSHNWTAGGTGPNRDASLVIWDRRANRYLSRLFDYDWNQIARKRTSNEAVSPVRVVSVTDESPTPAGYRRISIAEFLGET